VKCKKNAFGSRALPGPAGGAYSAPQTPYLDLREGRPVATFRHEEAVASSFLVV